MTRFLPAALVTLLSLITVTTANAGGVTGIDVTSRGNMYYRIRLVDRAFDVSLNDRRGIRTCFTSLEEGTPNGWRRIWEGFSQCGVVSSFAALDGPYGDTYGYRTIVYGGDGRGGGMQQKGWISFKTTR